MSGQAVSLITTVYNEGDNISAFLESYRLQTVYASEVVIVDGGSVDDTAVRIESFAQDHPDLNIRLIVDPTCSRGFSAGPIARGRNRAIEEANSPIIAVTDAGCMMDEDWLEEITGPFYDDPPADVVAGYYRNADHTKFLYDYAAMLIPLEKDYLPSSRSIAFRKSCWKQVGGYPEESYTAEDTMFDLRLKGAGFRFVFNRRALVTWQFARNKEELKYKLRQYGLGEGMHGLYPGRYLYRFCALFFPPLMLPKLLLEGRQRRLTLSKLYFFYWQQCIGYLVGLRKRHR